jgi:hypothetical protein
VSATQEIELFAPLFYHYKTKMNHIHLTYSPNHVLLILTIEDLVGLNPVRWVHNRPADELRVVSMASSIFRNRSAFDTVLHLHYNTAENRYEILDGLHRYSAIKHIYDNNSQINPDFITGNEYGYGRSATWFYNASILVSLHIDKSPGELHVIFENLNKAVPISEIYIPPATNETQLRKQRIIDAAADWQRRFPKHFSASNSFQMPNMNRDRFMDILAEVYDKSEDKDLTNILNRTNDHFAALVKLGRHKVSDATLKKCTETGCWLFVYKGDALISALV